MPTVLTEEEKAIIQMLRHQGRSYSGISRVIGRGRRTITRYCEQSGIAKGISPNILEANRRTGECRRKICVCKYCGRSYHPKKAERDKYCSRDCYFQARKTIRPVKELARHINVSTFEELAALLDVPDMNEVLKDIPSAEKMLKDVLPAEEALKHIPVSELNDPDIDEVLKEVPSIEELGIPSIDDFRKDER